MFLQNVMDCSELVSGLQDLAEAAYIIEKLYNMTLHQSCVAAQKEATVKELEARNHQVFIIVILILTLHSN